MAFLDAVRPQVAVITRLRLDAALFEPAPLTVGRPRCKGERLPTLQARLDDPNTPWQECTIHAWYATGKRTLQIVSDTAVWYHAGLPPVPIRWLVVKDPNGQFPPQALLSTDETITPKQMLTYFIQRWTVETTFEEARAHLGMETQRSGMTKPLRTPVPYLLSWLLGYPPQKNSLSRPTNGVVSQNKPHVFRCTRVGAKTYLAPFFNVNAIPFDIVSYAT